jgi:hypothetical protein
MKAILIICLLLLSCTPEKDPPLDEEIIISRLVGKWKVISTKELKSPEEAEKPKKCELDDEVEFLEEGYFVYRVNEKCSKYDHDHAIRWRLKEIEKKFYLEFYETEFKSTEFQARALVEKINFEDLSLKYLKNEESKKVDKKGAWYIQKSPISGNFLYTMHLNRSK